MDVVNHAKFHQNRFIAFGSLRGRNLPFSYVWRYGLYNRLGLPPTCDYSLIYIESTIECLIANRPTNKQPLCILMIRMYVVLLWHVHISESYALNRVNFVVLRRRRACPAVPRAVGHAWRCSSVD